MRKLWLPALLISFSTPSLASPSDMSVATFLGKMEALKAKGMMAMMSADVGLLKGAATAAGQDYRARLAKERSVGHPSSCPPAKSALGSGQLIAHLKSYPEPARPQVSMRQAMSDYFIRTFPCK